MKRRDFLKYIGAGVVGSGVGLGIPQMIKRPGAKLIPYLIPPKDMIPGVPSWYASVCRQCGAGCGILVKVLEGRAKKVEGNPLHPVNKGGLCARGQSGLQALYNPDRITGPLKRTGERGSGRYKEISWDEAIKTVADKLKGLGDEGDADKLWLISSSERGHLGKLAGEFMAAYGSKNHIEYNLFQNKNLKYAGGVTVGTEDVPFYDIENTKYLLSFGADFASTWLSPVGLSHGYGQMRQGGGKASKRGKLVQVEPRMSLTGANADKWVPARPGSEAILALAIAREIVVRGYYHGGNISGWKTLLAPYKLSAASKATDVAPETISHIARDLAKTTPSLVIGGDSLSSYNDGISGQVAVNILNHLAGNIGRKGGVVLNPERLLKAGRRAALKNQKMSRFIDAASGGSAKALIIDNTNPVFTMPKASKVEQAIRNVPFVASFATFIDESSAMADIILPANTFYEDWGDDFTEPGVGKGVATIMQPAVAPVFKTKARGDIYIEVAKAHGGKLADKLNHGTFAKYLNKSWKKLYKSNKAMANSALTFTDFWNRLLENGGWWDKRTPQARSKSVSVASVRNYLPKAAASFGGDKSGYPLNLVVYPTTGMYDGRGANSPWLQEFPDTMTAVVWGSWVEINPKTAAKLKIKEGDTVSVSTPEGSIELPAHIYAAIRPDTIAIPIGQGHTQYGRIAKDRGANPLEILPFIEDKKSGEIALNTTRASLSRKGRAKKGSDDSLVRAAANNFEYGRDYTKIISPAKFAKIGKEDV
ncbi:Molybdopterin oxidoreductase, iron-sulfur binding subunit [hydrothermal vent metagenome]|uniref:Molybdopterin oxidoreductase, iron-sulfur binding subunit n=1 Tax=hydrothermal vent metagenome TaxID=652676 RepID=A0A3B0QVV7_9ZZZZ